MSLLSISGLICSDIEQGAAGYENQIVAIEEFETPTATKIIVSFEHSSPVCVYSPENFQESVDDTVYRAFMPRTSVGSDVVCSIGDDDQEGEHVFDCDSDDAGVELVFYGESIKKIIGSHHVVFVVKK